MINFFYSNRLYLVEEEVRDEARQRIARNTSRGKQRKDSTERMYPRI